MHGVVRPVMTNLKSKPTEKEKARRSTDKKTRLFGGETDKDARANLIKTVGSKGIKTFFSSVQSNLEQEKAFE